MVTIKTEKDIQKLREGGKRHALILKKLCEAVHPGVNARDLDTLAVKLIALGGDKPAFLGYRPERADRDYPATLCVSVNEEIVHGIPNEEEKTLKNGDIVTLDLGVIHDGLYTDAAVTVIVGKGDQKAKKLVDATRKSLEVAIKAAQPGKHIGDIGAAIEKFVRPLGFGIVEGLAGHGVGFEVHEDPYVPNTGIAGEGEELKPGMVIAIEPMLSEGSEEIELLPDGYTYITADKSRAAHFEHTVLITNRGPEILTTL